MAGFDICAIGHVTNDVIIDPHGSSREATGGAAYYAGVALRHLGLRTLVVSTAAARDIPKFAAEFAEHRVDFRCTASPRTTAFENRYGETTGRRVQRINAVARAFDLSDLDNIDAACFHLGPLTPDEIPCDCFEALSGRGARISLDLQGFTRDVSNGEVRVVGWPAKSEFLKFVHFLKANRWEAAAVTNDADPVSAARRLARMGPEEVIVTLADKGAILCAGQDVYEIPATPATIPSDPTGCGDTFCAGYLFARARGRPAPEAARFAAALAAAKRMCEGPFTGTAADVEALLSG
jgi:sugar/nucleoside kinase (ribokinase family)